MSRTFLGSFSLFGLVQHTAEWELISAQTVSELFALAFGFNTSLLIFFLPLFLIFFFSVEVGD